MSNEDFRSPEFHYHSDAIPRDVSATAMTPRKKKNEARNVGWSITLLDLFFILCFAIIFVPQLLRKGARTEWSGYQWNLKNQVFAGETLIALRVKATQKAVHTQEPYQVQFYADDQTITPTPMQVILPDIDEENMVRLTVPALKGERLRAVISIRGKTLELANSIAKDGS